jgi:hypothetical protein
MGVDVLLKQVSQTGTSSKRRRLTQLDVVPDGDDVFARVCAHSKLPLLSRVDPYGDLLLTVLEMPQFIAEVNEELGIASTDPERELTDARSGIRSLRAADAATSGSVPELL